MSTTPPTSACPVCGALTGGASCDEIFGELMALEYSNPEIWDVHALTVATFMVQHGRYSDEALEWIFPQMRALLDEGLTGEKLRKIARHDLHEDDRGWKVTRRPGGPPLPAAAWEMTIADVARQVGSAESYRQAVRAWARITLRQQNFLSP